MERKIPEELYPDFVILNANVITVDPKDTIVEAIAIKGDRIVKVGSTEEIKTFIGDKTEVMNLERKTVVPGFIDTHVHNVMFGEWMRSINAVVELYPTITDLQKAIREKIEAGETWKGWIQGRNYEPNRMAEKRWPTKAEIDEASPDNPVSILIRGGHSRVVNSKALELAGINKDTPQPEGGVIGKDPETQEPTGVLADTAAYLVNKLIPQPTIDEIKEGLAAASKAYTKIGITSTGDAGMSDRPESYRAYQEAVQEGKLKFRTYLMINRDFYRENDLGLRTGFGNDKLKLGAAKLVLDGSIQCYTSPFYEPYITLNPDGEITKGLEGLRYTQDQFNEIVSEAHRLGYQVATHAQGDLAIDIALNAIEYAMKKYPREDPRHRLEHTLCPTMDALKRMKELGIVSSWYVFHPWFWGDQHINNFIGKERANRMVPIKSAMDLGIVSCAHSDCPVATPDAPVWPSNPLWGMWCAVNRKTRRGVDIGPQEKLTAMEALRIYTLNGAYASFEENLKGSIEPGKLADLVVLSDDPRTVDPSEIRNITVEKTIIGGEIVYEA